MLRSSAFRPLILLYGQGAMPPEPPSGSFHSVHSRERPPSGPSPLIHSITLTPPIPFGEPEVSGSPHSIAPHSIPLVLLIGKGQGLGLYLLVVLVAGQPYGLSGIKGQGLLVALGA